jgi:hypothetical protein
MFRKLTRPEILAVAILIAVTGLATWPNAEAQLGDGGSGGGGEFTGNGIETDEIIIEPSKSGKTLYGYSQKTGSWDKLSAEPHGDDGLTPVVSGTMAVVRGNERLHVFKAVTGRWFSSPEVAGNLSPVVISSSVAAAVAGNQVWAVGNHGQSTWVEVDIGEPAMANQMAVHASRVVYRTDTHVHVFSNASGKWASVDLTED